MFESLSEKLQASLSKISGKGKLSEKDVDMAMREVKMALLEADVNFKVVKEFISKVKERAVGKEVMESLTPAQQVIKIVNEELTIMMGEKEEKINFSSKPTVILMCGLQGAGKTTTTAKLANHFKKDNKKSLMVGVDIYRPAAIKQLQVLGEQIDIPVFEMGTQKPADTVAEAYELAKKENYDIVLVDTAGRLHIDEVLMNELKEIKSLVKVDEVLLVLDAMTGQDAVNVAKAFDDELTITGVVLTKLDGDTRGGAALSIRSVVNKPIKFITTGEKLDKIESFKPDRLANRILGMGDVLSLIEKAEAVYDQKKAIELEKKMRDMSFTFDDFLEQMESLKKMGPLQDVLGLVPGMNSKAMKSIKVDEKQMARIEAIIKSMTAGERVNPDIIDGSRKNRIAKGSGTSPTEVQKLLKQFKDTKKMMKKVNGMMNGKKKKPGKMGFPFFK
ncbi:MAG: signal recognition particle protein [Ezakiella sp.]|nr:signal recognition particle protein [Ezakiella sp.]MDD7471556.1 signal recognition particle protein [Bacillota bacterium]MDY3922792.1 signal recognition particle protein [Ezakiella sp.]